jgi:hypothetical protein
MRRTLTPAENHARIIARCIIPLARSMDAAPQDLTQAHGALMDACEQAPMGPGWQWMAQEAVLEAMRLIVIEKIPVTVGQVLIACEEARDALRNRELAQ